MSERERAGNRERRQAVRSKRERAGNSGRGQPGPSAVSASTPATSTSRFCMCKICSIGASGKWVPTRINILPTSPQ
eukprot:m.210042 g.210042  ORF g.210042 m.210042 type:complete len:76 (+) comp10134_c0_seq109:1538-1765(+)